MQQPYRNINHTVIFLISGEAGKEAQNKAEKQEEVRIQRAQPI